MNDDRGNSVATSVQAQFLNRRLQAEAGRQARIRAVTRELESRELRVALQVAVVCAGSGLLVFLWLVSGGWGPRLAFLGLVSPVIAVVLWLALTVEGRYRKRLAELEARRDRARAECLACGYRMVGLPRQDDGCQVCPECGAAWRLERSVESSTVRAQSGNTESTRSAAAPG